MFGENGIFGKSYYKIDEKNRIILPKNTYREENDEIGFYEENELTFRIYNLKYLKDKLKYYEQKKEISNPEKYEQLINELTIRIMASGTVDSQFRLMIPSIIVKKYELEKNIIFHGGYDHLKVFKNEETYNEYVKLLQKRK